MMFARSACEKYMKADMAPLGAPFSCHTQRSLSLRATHFNTRRASQFAAAPSWLASSWACRHRPPPPSPPCAFSQASPSSPETTLPAQAGSPPRGRLRLLPPPRLLWFPLAIRRLLVVARVAGRAAVRLVAALEVLILLVGGGHPIRVQAPGARAVVLVIVRQRVHEALARLRLPPARACQLPLGPCPPPPNQPHKAGAGAGPRNPTAPAPSSSPAAPWPA